MAVETGWFDTIGHLDLPKRYAPKTHRDYDPARYRERLLPIFDAMIARGIAFRDQYLGICGRSPKTSMPGPAVVRWYADRGGTLITTGTDSHAAQTVGAGLAKTLDMLALCGIDAVASFREPNGDARCRSPPCDRGRAETRDSDATSSRSDRVSVASAARPPGAAASRFARRMGARPVRGTPWKRPVAVDQRCRRAAPSFLTSSLSLAGALDALQLPTGAAPVRIGARRPGAGHRDRS